MARIYFKNKIDKWATWDKVDLTPESSDGDFVRFKIGDAQRQIVISAHIKQWEMFLKNMPEKEPAKQEVGAPHE